MSAQTPVKKPSVMTLWTRVQLYAPAVLPTLALIAVMAAVFRLGAIHQIAYLGIEFMTTPQFNEMLLCGLIVVIAALQRKGK